MDKTTVSVSFSIYGNDFDLNDVIERMEVEPTETRIKGEIPEGGRRQSIETSWTISTKEENSFDINDQLNQLITLLKPKKDILLKIKHDFQVSFVFMILVKVRNNETAAMYFDENTLEFINYIKATIDIDLYVC